MNDFECKFSKHCSACTQSGKHNRTSTTNNYLGDRTESQTQPPGFPIIVICDGEGHGDGESEDEVEDEGESESEGEVRAMVRCEV